MANDARVCSECGAELTTDSPQGLCPRCLLKLARGSSESVVSCQLSGEETVLETGPRVAASPALPREGQRFGDYQLVRLLGEGGMGAVYEADHLPSERRVALKVLTHRLNSTEARQRFLREGQLAASINHPNSVYVFGTEEIDGIPVISMELAPGGTLKDRVKEKGPLPVTEAVDVILQVIAGLEAAHAKGVLHRDIKPSNCFVDADGTVKVGDFGLSISTLARTDTQLTVTGRILGTPAFASPEQLRGDELDVRSDIYSVGVTLYYLLTGRVPFEETNLVKLLTMVVERPADSPAKLRREVPRQLAQAVLRCLAKAKESRYGNYDELRQALRSFDSSAPTPASLPIRSLAGFIDLALLTVVMLLVRGAWLDGMSKKLLLSAHLPGALLTMFSIPAIYVLYFTVTEGIWGASAGKALCSLRVVRESGEAPGMGKALVRALMFVLVFFELGDLILLILQISGPIEVDWIRPIKRYAGLGGLALLFSAAGPENGFLAWHDLLTRTQVVLRRQYRPGRKARSNREPRLTVESSPSFGPYQVLNRLSPTGPDEWLLGYDSRLQRRVWIHRLPAGSPPINVNRRNLNRVGRLRWLNGKRTTRECWDAYEALDGNPLLNLLNASQPWARVRQWLADLAVELEAGLKDHSLPVLGLDRVWITAEGRAKLLDFAAPRTVELSNSCEETRSTEANFERIQEFLYEVATTALQGRSALPPPAPQQEPALLSRMLDLLWFRTLFERRAQTMAVPLPIPLHANTLLTELAVQAFEGPEPLVRRLKGLLDEPTIISRRKRLGLILGCCFLPTIMAALKCYSWSANPELAGYLDEQRKLLIALAQCLAKLEHLKQESPPQDSMQAREKKALEIYIAGHFHGAFMAGYTRPLEPESQPVWIKGDGDQFWGQSVKPIWFSLYARSFISGTQRKLGERILGTQPVPSERELNDATTLLQPFLQSIETDSGNPFSTLGAHFQVEAERQWSRFAGFCLFCSLLFRGGLLLHGLRIAVVTRAGRKVSRMRMFWRSLLTWSPLFLIHLFIYERLLLWWEIRGPLWLILLLFVLFIGGTVVAVVKPDRGLQDHLAGTWLVPR